MSRCPIILFLIISLLIGVYSCSPSLKGYNLSSENEIVFRPVFSSDFDKAIYKFQSQFKKKQLTGILLIKKMPDANSYRTVFMSETGLKYFDFEFFQNDSVKHRHIMEGLDRKSLISIITSDFSLLFKSQFDQAKTEYYRSENNENLIIYLKEKGRYYYSYESNDMLPSAAEKRNCFSPPIKIATQANDTNTPEKITFTHGFLGYTMKLELLDQ